MENYSPRGPSEDSLYDLLTYIFLMILKAGSRKEKASVKATPTRRVSGFYIRIIAS